MKKIKQILLNIAEPKLNQYNFYFDRDNSGSDVWEFVREAGEIKHYITFDKSNFTPNAIRVSLHTSTYFSGVQGYVLAGKGDIWWQYKDKETLEHVINELVNLVIEKGLPWFDLVSRPFHCAPFQIKKRIIEENEKLAAEFSEKYGLFITQQDVLHELEKLVQEKDLYGVQLDWEFVLGASAFFGEFVRNKLGGEWMWEEEYDTPVIGNIGGREVVCTDPLSTVLRFALDPYARIRGEFSFLKASLTP